MPVYLISICELNAQIYTHSHQFSVGVDHMIFMVAGYLAASGLKMSANELDLFSQFLSRHMHYDKPGEMSPREMIEKAIVAEIHEY